ncbi:helix-turn-helix domain-containing protein [Methylocystis heyeri]|uniref:XRE family transcriptional regulator n=1 Tax=Methylocystis heyeri TaxID=391905 RepID=A0A6B8KK89_9HYPH|nr:helix-turn-helix transcriptional regulator [Methylocystis heyeri]QGM47048.1 XRE family transcriptional regulator [Methylocystis heyeri]
MVQETDNLLKAEPVRRIAVLMRERGLRQIEAAGFFGVTQPDVSKLLHGDFRQFSVERLLRFLAPLGQDVEIVVRP